MNVFKRLAGQFVGKFVLRAQLIPIGELRGLRWIWSKLFYSKAKIKAYQDLYPNFEKRAKAYNLNVKREMVATPDGVELDTIELCASENTGVQKYIIYAFGRNDCYEKELDRLATDALNLNKKIISFNFRGVGHSKGTVTNETDLENDYYYQVKRLLDKGIPPENIICYAHSLGAGVATFSIDRLRKEQGVTFKFFNDRSFSSLLETSLQLFFAPYRRARKNIVFYGTISMTALFCPALFMMGAITPLQALASMGLILSGLMVKPLFPVYDAIVGNTLDASLRWIMSFGGWVINAGEVFDNYPHEYKSHTVLCKPKTKQSYFLGKRDFEQATKDKVIPHPESLHKSLKLRRKYKDKIKGKYSQTLKEALELLKQLGPRDRTQKLNARIQDIQSRALVLEQELRTLSNCKFTGGKHMSRPKAMLTRYNDEHAKRRLTGREVFYAFVEPNEGHAEQRKRNYREFDSSMRA